LLNEPIISNTTPLIKLAGVGLLDLLPRLYGAVWIPEAVRMEYQDGAKVTDPNLDALPWMRVVPVAFNSALPANLGRGEAAVISLALEYSGRPVLIDDKMGRHLAERLNLPIIGTLGVLLAAKRVGLIAAVRPLVDEMLAQGRHISLYLRASVIRMAGEED
jgi:predicted nucleic acid-binding protein